MDLRSQFGTSPAREFVDARRHPRFKLEVDIRVYPRNNEVVRGHTVDINESGISARLREEVPFGKVVRLEFTLPQWRGGKYSRQFANGALSATGSSSWSPAKPMMSLGEPAASSPWDMVEPEPKI